MSAADDYLFFVRRANGRPDGMTLAQTSLQCASALVELDRLRARVAELEAVVDSAVTYVLASRAMDEASNEAIPRSTEALMAVFAEHGFKVHDAREAFEAAVDRVLAERAEAAPERSKG